MRKQTASLLIAVAVLAAALPTVACAQGEETAVRIATADGVTLRGHFLAGDKKSACVLILHDLGELKHDKAWRQFGETLHKNGFAVLQLHLRGYGRSTEVGADTFWSPHFGANRKLVQSDNKDEIEFQKFNSVYHQFLINDIATAKAYLDRKNDSGQCNSSNLALICPGRSGALAAAWINSEMHRYRQMPPPFMGAPAQLSNSPEGENVLCALFINLSPQIGKRKLALSSTLQGASRRKVPFIFFHGSEDGPGKAIAKETEKAVNPGGKIAFTGISELSGTKAEDVEKCVATDKDLHKELVRYLKQVQEERGKEWEETEWQEAVYVWRNPYAPNSLISYNQAGNNTPPFVNYELFLPSR